MDDATIFATGTGFIIYLTMGIIIAVALWTSRRKDY